MRIARRSSAPIARSMVRPHSTPNIVSVASSPAHFEDAGLSPTGSARQAPLHSLHAAGIGAAGDDAEVSARLFERLRIDVGFDGGFLEVADSLQTLRKLVAEKSLRALAAVGGFIGCAPARLLAFFLGNLLARVEDGRGAALQSFRELRIGRVRFLSQRGDGSLARL